MLRIQGHVQYRTLSVLMNHIHDYSPEPSDGQYGIYWHDTSSLVNDHFWNMPSYK